MNGTKEPDSGHNFVTIPFKQLPNPIADWSLATSVRRPRAAREGQAGHRPKGQGREGGRVTRGESGSWIIL